MYCSVLLLTFINLKCTDTRVFVFYSVHSRLSSLDETFVQAIRQEKSQYDGRHNCVDVRLIKPDTDHDDFICSVLDEYENAGHGNFVCQKVQKKTIQYHCER